jgi:hypothetical protein
MLTALVLTALLAEATPAPQPNAKAHDQSAEQSAKPAKPAKPAQRAEEETPILDSKTNKAASEQGTPVREEAPINRKIDNPIMPPLPDGTAGSQVLEPGKSPVEPHRDTLPNELSDVPLAPTGPAPPAATPQQGQESHTGKTGGGANRVDSIR